MKKVFLVIAIALFSLNIFSQQKINPNDLIGYWRPSEETTQLFFWKDLSGDLQMQEICGSTGEPLDLLTLRVEETYIFASTVFKVNSWLTNCTYTLINKSTLKCVITGSGQGTVYYTKIK